MPRSTSKSARGPVGATGADTGACRAAAAAALHRAASSCSRYGSTSKGRWLVWRGWGAGSGSVPVRFSRGSSSACVPKRGVS